MTDVPGSGAATASRVPKGVPEHRGADPLLTAVEYLLATLLAFMLFLAPITGALISNVGKRFVAGDSNAGGKIGKRVVGANDKGGAGSPDAGSSGALDDLLEVADSAATPVAVLFFLTLGFQIIQASYPWIVSRRRNRSMEDDWRFISKLPDDIGVGLLLALGCFFGAQIATVGMGRLVGLENTEDASNTDILTDNQGSIWLIGVILLVVVGAPLAEELLFRGLILRTLKKYIGAVAAIIVSSILFAIPHWQPGASWQETAVLLAALGVVGLILAIGAIVTDRLGPSVIAHFFFNLTGTLLTLI